MADENDKKTPEEPAFAEETCELNEEKLASAGKKVEDLKKAIEDCGFKVEDEGNGEIKILE